MQHITAFTPLPHLDDQSFFNWTIYGAGIAVAVVLIMMTTYHLNRRDKSWNTFAEGGRAGIVGAVIVGVVVGAITAVVIWAAQTDAWENNTIAYLNTEQHVSITAHDAGSLRRGQTIASVQDGKTITIRLSNDGAKLIHADGSPLEKKHDVH